MSLTICTFVIINSTIPPFLDLDTMDMQFSSTTKNGMFLQKYLFNIASKLLKPIKHLCKMLAITKYSPLCPLDTLKYLEFSTNNLNIGQLLNLMFSSLSQKSSLIFIFSHLTKAICMFEYLFSIPYNFTVPALFTQKMSYDANFYKITCNIS